MPLEEYIVIDKKKARFQGADWHTPMESLNIFIIGCGNLGSWLALDLARKGHTLHLFDGDKIEEENIGCQLYSTNQIGCDKAGTTRYIVQEFSGNENIEVYDKYTKDSMTNPIIFCCVDSMKIRKLIFNKWKEQENREIFIDTRNGFELTECYCVIKDNEEMYEKTLFKDSEASEVPCNLKSTQHSCFIGVGLMSGVFCNYLANKNLGFNLREIPFYQSFEIPFCRYEIQC